MFLEKFPYRVKFYTKRVEGRVSAFPLSPKGSRKLESQGKVDLRRKGRPFAFCEAVTAVLPFPGDICSLVA